MIQFGFANESPPLCVLLYLRSSAVHVESRQLVELVTLMYFSGHPDVFLNHLLYLLPIPSGSCFLNPCRDKSVPLTASQAFGTLVMETG